MVARRRYALVEVVTAMGLAVTLIGSFGLVMRSQVLEVRVTSDWLRAREALVTASDELQAGTIPVPAPGKTVKLSAPKHVALTCERASEVDQPLARLASVGRGQEATPAQADSRPVRRSEVRDECNFP